MGILILCLFTSLILIRLNMTCKKKLNNNKKYSVSVQYNKNYIIDTELFLETIVSNIDLIDEFREDKGSYSLYFWDVGKFNEVDEKLKGTILSKL